MQEDSSTVPNCMSQEMLELSLRFGLLVFLVLMCARVIMAYGEPGSAAMPVILLGALGGMVTGDIVGLFVGAMLLAVGYHLFMDWVAKGAISAAAAADAAESNPD